MASLQDYLADLNEPRVLWIKARVASVQSGVLTLTYQDGTITNAAYLQQYTPVVGDIVHCLSYEPMGVLVLGKAVASGAGSITPVPQTPVIVASSSRATYNSLLSTWSTGVTQQGQNLIGCFFYTPGAFSALSSTTFQAVEIEVTLTSGGPPEFIRHMNAGATGAVLSPAGDLWRPNAGLVPGVATWVSLPIGWGKELVSGAIKGIGITSTLNTVGVYSGTGRVRLTPLSVTI